MGVVILLGGVRVVVVVAEGVGHGALPGRGDHVPGEVPLEPAATRGVRLPVAASSTSPPVQFTALVSTRGDVVHTPGVSRPHSQVVVIFVGTSVGVSIGINVGVGVSVSVSVNVGVSVSVNVGVNVGGSVVGSSGRRVSRFLGVVGENWSQDAEEHKKQKVVLHWIIKSRLKKDYASALNLIFIWL